MHPHDFGYGSSAICEYCEPNRVFLGHGLSFECGSILCQNAVKVFKSSNMSRVREFGDDDTVSILSKEDLGELLCDYCPLPDSAKGVHCYGGEPVMCEGSHCEEAYHNYLEEVEEQIKEDTRDRQIKSLGTDLCKYCLVEEHKRSSCKDLLSMFSHPNLVICNQAFERYLNKDREEEEIF